MSVKDYTYSPNLNQHHYSERVWHNLACPNCRGPLQRDDHGAHCLICGTLYGRTESGALDLRLTSKKIVSLDYEVGTRPLPDYAVNFEPLDFNETPEVDFSGIRMPHNLSPKIRSYFPRAKSRDSMMLDLGCGNPIYREIAECAGFEYVGMDFEVPEAPLMGDAQALPFRSNTFELIWSNSVFQYLPQPAVMMAEAYRVLKPGGMFLGTAGFMEPFDGDSFQMYSRLGILHLFHEAGFKVLRIAPDDWWTGLVAMSRMGLFPRMPAALTRALVMPLETLSKWWWQFGAKSKNGVSAEANRLSRITGGHQFIAIKE